MAQFFITAYFVFISIWSKINAVTDSRCQRIIDVNENEFGIVYEYFYWGNNIVCAYEFNGGEGQHILLAVSHIGLFPKKTDECTAQLIITDVTSDGIEIPSSVICNEDDIKKKGGFVSTGNSAKVTINGHSGDGILLLQYWFVKQVILIDRVVDEESTMLPVVNKPVIISKGPLLGCNERRDEFRRANIDVQCDQDNFFRPLQCSHWGADINLSRCICVDKTGKRNELIPPYCLPHPDSFEARCLQIVAKFRLRVSFMEKQFMVPPACDESGNFKKLQCRYNGEDCICVNPTSGNATNLAPPLCELPTVTGNPLTTTAVTPSYNSSSCIVFFCTLMCKSGIYAKNEDGCPICACEPYEEVAIKKCPEVRSQKVAETIEQWNLNETSQSYSWIPACSMELYSLKQSNHIAGYFCVDQLTGQPSGKELTSCVSYKSCVTERIMGFSKALRKAGYKRTSKEVKRLISSDNNANELSRVWNLMNEEERNNIFLESSIFIPSCNAYGDFNSLQCNYATGWCWCVDMFGDQIEESSRSVTQTIPDCAQYVSQPAAGPVYIDGMYDFGFEEFDSWNVLATFENFNISDNIYYFWTKNDVPVPLILENKFSINTWYEAGEISIGLSVNNASRQDTGIYRCNLIKSSKNFVSSETAEAQLYSEVSYDYGVDYTCSLRACDIICSFGYRYEGICATCECWQKTDIENFLTLEQMKIDIANSFGAIDGRCEAKRQWIIKELTSRDFTNKDSSNFDLPPECDSNGNFMKTQKYNDLGRVCVDVMTGHPNGRMLPDCIERTPCVKDQFIAIESHLKLFLTDLDLVNGIIEKVTKTESIQEQHNIYYTSLIEIDTPEYIKLNENVSDFLTLAMCQRETGLYYGHLCNYGIDRECWCVDTFGNEIEGSRYGVNETEYSCEVPATSAKQNESMVNMIRVGNTELTTEINSTVQLKCSITATSADAFVIWSTPYGYFEHVSIIDKRIKLIGDGITDFTLQIKDVNYDDQGTYYCFLHQYLSGYSGNIAYDITIDY